MRRSAFILAVVLCVPTLRAQTTQPSASIGEVQLRATEAFNQGQYALALPLLQKVAVAYKDQPDQLGSVDEQIRVCERNIATSATVTTPPANSAALATTPRPLTIPNTAEHRTPHPAPKTGEVREMLIKDLGNFEFDAEKGSPLPDDVKALNGSTIRLRGFMIPMDQAENITQFALVPSLFACCFGQPPQVQHTIVVNCPKGKAISYFPDEISVEGELKVEVKKDDGFVVSVFEMNAASVKPAAK